MITEVLREDLGYDGIIVTDAMNMGAVVSQYASGEAAVAAVRAGADVILMPQNLQSAAVRSGVISEERIDASVRRLIRVKLKMKR